MPRESVDAKGHRYLCEGRVTIRRVEGREVDAEVRGSDLWYVTRRRGGWTCDCPAVRRCAHLAAVALVTAPSRERPGGLYPVPTTEGAPAA
jgi:uncharacterized Zn finger protein